MFLNTIISDNKPSSGLFNKGSLTGLYYQLMNAQFRHDLWPVWSWLTPGWLWASESHWPWGNAHLQLLSFGVLRIAEGGVNPVIVFDTALRCVLRHGERLTHQRQPADRLHHQLLQVVVWDLLRRRKNRRWRESVQKPSGFRGVRGRQVAPSLRRLISRLDLMQTF